MVRQWIATAIVGDEVEYQTVRPISSAARLALVRWAVERFPGQALSCDLSEVSIKSEADILDVYTSVFEYNLQGANVFTFVRLCNE